MSRRLKKALIIHKSGLQLSGKAVDTIKKHAFEVLELSVGGDAPKDVVKIYQYDGRMRKTSLKTWPTYIVKIGQKWYPNESITEYLLSRIGEIAGLDMAESKLFKIEGLLRYCSRHFHSKLQRLDHGAEIISRYIEEPNPQWIDYLIEKNYLSNFHIRFWQNSDLLEKVYHCIDHQFCNLMILERRNVIKETLKLRFQKLQKVLADVT